MTDKINQENDSVDEGDLKGKVCRLLCLNDATFP